MTGIVDDPPHFLENAVLVVVRRESMAVELVRGWTEIVVFAGNYFGSVAHGVQVDVVAVGLLADEDSVLKYD